ncbi:hypothetical protein ABH924_004333 [Arthrobacter sp. GAS37]
MRDPLFIRSRSDNVLVDPLMPGKRPRDLSKVGQFFDERFAGSGLSDFESLFPHLVPQRASKFRVIEDACRNLSSVSGNDFWYPVSD